MRDNDRNKIVNLGYDRSVFFRVVREEVEGERKVFINAVVPGLRLE